MVKRELFNNSSTVDFTSRIGHVKDADSVPEKIVTIRLEVG